MRMVTCKSCGLSSESGLHTCKGFQFGTEEKEDGAYTSNNISSDTVRNDDSDSATVNSFTAHGFEVPSFDGEILKEVKVGDDGIATGRYMIGTMTL
jgi:hypothetical protein